ncbi:hypothetical protein M0P98_01340 [bacterium]|nr:hypothetical protein [bacterium]
MKKTLYSGLFLLQFTILFGLSGCKTPANINVDTDNASVYNNWPQVQFEGCRILLATEPQLAHQGFAIASYRDFDNTIIIFPNISEGTKFINHNQGYGAVKRDLKIVFFDSEMNILKEDIMTKEDGFSVAPPKTSFAIEGLPAK